VRLNGLIIRWSRFESKPAPPSSRGRQAPDSSSLDRDRHHPCRISKPRIHHILSERGLSISIFEILPKLLG
jgi:hypothetical protein